MKTEKGKCWFEIYVDGRAIMQQTKAISSKWKTIETAKKFKEKIEKNNPNRVVPYKAIEIIPFCPHLNVEDCQACTKEFN